jgi:hypothetical protein
MALHRHADRGRVFGANGHDMVLEPPLSDSDLGDLEAVLGVTLPQDYRGFLTQVGAGGAGPAYGVFPVRRKPDGGWRWEGDGANLTQQELVKVPFLVERPYATILEQLRDECPDEENFGDIDEYDTAMEQWEQRLWAVFGEPGFTGGGICLVHYGCAQRAWLVVSGSARGQMWWDRSCDEEDLEPMLEQGANVSFGAWYLRWLISAETELTSGT